MPVLGWKQPVETFMSSRKVTESQIRELRMRFSMVDQLSVMYRLIAFVVCVTAIPLYTFLTWTRVLPPTAYMWFVPLCWITWLTLCACAVVINFYFRARPRHVLLPRADHESRKPALYMTRFR